MLHSASVWLPQTQTWIYNQVRYLPAEVESHIVCETTQNLDQFHLPNIHSLSAAPRWRYCWEKGRRKLGIRNPLAFLVDQVRRHRPPQVLHSHFGEVGWGNREVAEQEGLKHVVTFYGSDINYLPSLDQHWRGRYRALFERVDRVLCEGPHLARTVVSFGCPTEKVRVHHLGVRVDEIAFRPRVWSRAEPLRVLIAASFREKKGIPYALEALGRVQDEVSMEITIIGDANSEPRNQIERKVILDSIKKHNLQSRVRLLGYQPYAVLCEEAYRNHIFLSPSVTARDGDAEGGAPVAILEMVATGMPVVSTKHCDIPEVIDHGRTGLLAEERDVEGLVCHLRWLIDHPEQWDRLVEAGRKLVESEFNCVLQGKRLRAIYQEELEDGAHKGLKCTS